MRLPHESFSEIQAHHRSVSPNNFMHTRLKALYLTPRLVRTDAAAGVNKLNDGDPTGKAWARHRRIRPFCIRAVFAFLGGAQGPFVGDPFAKNARTMPRTIDNCLKLTVLSTLLVADHVCLPMAQKVPIWVSVFCGRCL